MGPFSQILSEPEYFEYIYDPLRTWMVRTPFVPLRGAHLRMGAVGWKGLDGRYLSAKFEAL